MTTTLSLADWQHVLLLSNQMMNLAKNQQWEALINGELNYIRRVETLSMSNGEFTDYRYSSKIQEILHQLLDNETEIKRLLLARMDELKMLIHRGNQQQSVNIAYGQMAGILLLPNLASEAIPVINHEL